MENSNPHWKHDDSRFLTVLGFIAYHLGYYKFRIRAMARFIVITALTVAVLYGILYLFDLSVQIHRNGEAWFMIQG